ncbi:hypothetical protein D3C76_987740 [compost metagenome]
MQWLFIIGGVRLAIAQLAKRIEPRFAQQAFELCNQCLDPQGLATCCYRPALDFGAIDALMGCQQVLLIAFAKVQGPAMVDEVRYRQAR